MAPFPHSSGYVEDQAARELSRLLEAGQEAVQAAALAGNKALGMYPRAGESRDAYLPGESPVGGKATLYEARVRQAVLSPIYAESVEKCASGPLREAITLDGWGPKITEWEQDLDGSGNSTRPFLTDVLPCQAFDGIHFVLVDLETVDAGRAANRSEGDDDRAGLRPYAVPILAADFDPLSSTFIGGQLLLTGCAIYQEATARGPEGEELQSAAWREFRLTESGVVVRDHVLKKADRTADVDKLADWRKVRPIGSGELARIPVVAFRGDFKAPFFRGQPPYSGAASLAAGTFRSRAEKDDFRREIARLRLHQNHVALDERQNPKLQMQGNVLYNTGDGTAKVLESTGSALRELRADLTEDEKAVRSACNATAVEGVTGAVTAFEVGVRAIEGGTRQEVQTQINAAAYRRLLETMEIMGGVDPSGGTVSWQYESLGMLSDPTLARMHDLTMQPGPDGRPLLPLSTYLYLERAAGKLPENFDIEAAVAGTLTTTTQGG